MNALNKKIFACIAAVVMSAFMLCSCSEKSANAMEYNDPNGKVTAAASQGLMSLWIGVQKDSSSDYLAFVEA